MFKNGLPKSKTYRSVVPFGFLLAIFTLTACPPIDPEKDRIVVIFSDVTSSLKESENYQVGTLTSDILDNLLPGTRYYVYPIQVEAQKLEPMVEGIIVAEDSPESTKAVQVARRKKLGDKIKELYELIKRVKRSGVHGNPDNHTCILYTLEFAQNIFGQFDPKKTQFELIYVSDMIEQCNSTPMGKPISLGKDNISESIKLAQETDLKLSMSAAGVSMILPATNDTYVTGGRPNPSHLRDFWKAILLHCGFSKEFLEDETKFYFSSGVPTRFRLQQSGSTQEQ